MSNWALQFQDVTFSYEQSSSVLEKLSFHVNQGELVSVIGPSGSGKSTLFRLITGLEHPSNGEILINNENKKNRLGMIGYMPQQDLLMPWRSIMANAILPLELKGIKKKVAEAQVKELLEEFGLKGMEKKFPGDLSGGMRQRVSFLRTILTGSNVLLLDEPFSALDAITRLSMQEWLLEQWTKLNKTILFITHDVDEALFLSDRIFVFSDMPVKALQEIHIPLERPRNIRDLGNQEIIELKAELISELRTKVRL